MRAEPRLRLDRRFTHLVTRGDLAVLVGDGDPLVVEDGRAAEVLPLLDGRRSAPEIAGALEDRHPPALVHFILLQLMASGVAVEVGEAEGGSGLRGESLGWRLRAVWEARGGVRCVEVPPGVWEGPGGCRLLLCDDYLRPEVASARGEGTGPLLLAALGPRRPWLGPLLGPPPGTSAAARPDPGLRGSCALCLQDRLRLNLTGLALVRDGDAGVGGPLVVSPLRTQALPEAWAALAAHLPDEPEGLAALSETLLVLPLDGPAPGTGAAEASPERHPVPRLPQCPACGDPSLTLPGATLTLRSRPRVATPGGYRICAPEATWARHAHLLSPLTGVVRRIRELPVPGVPLAHVYTASHAHHHGRGGIRAVKDGRRDHSGGKGRTDADARASALCESLERFSSVHRGDEPTRVARRSELGAEAVAPQDVLCFSDAQYAGRKAWNRAQRGGFQRVPEPYGDEPIAWAGARSLSTGSERPIPAALLYFGFRGPGQQFCDGDSNGVAGGNCLEEAILQGFLELAERDAVALWWYNRVARPGVDLASAGDPWIDGVSELYRSLGRDVWALDLTTDLGLPTYVALSALEREREQDIIFGFGAHLDAGIALVRAFTELNQMLPTVLESREERARRLLPDFPDALTWWDRATTESEPYLRPAAGLGVPLPPPPPSEGDLLDDVHACVGRARAAGLDVLVHDLTRPDVGLPVAKVVVPGLRHFWRRLGPGRLYDAPVALGWIPRPLAEREMNPVSLFV